MSSPFTLWREECERWLVDRLKMRSFRARRLAGSGSHSYEIVRRGNDLELIATSLWSFGYGLATLLRLLQGGEWSRLERKVDAIPSRLAFLQQLASPFPTVVGRERLSLPQRLSSQPIALRLIDWGFQGLIIAPWSDEEEINQREFLSLAEEFALHGLDLYLYSDRSEQRSFDFWKGRPLFLICDREDHLHSSIETLPEKSFNLWKEYAKDHSRLLFLLPHRFLYYAQPTCWQRYFFERLDRESSIVLEENHPLQTSSYQNGFSLLDVAGSTVGGGGWPFLPQEHGINKKGIAILSDIPHKGSLTDLVLFLFAREGSEGSEAVVRELWLASERPDWRDSPLLRLLPEVRDLIKSVQRLTLMRRERSDELLIALQCECAFSQLRLLLQTSSSFSSEREHGLGVSFSLFLADISRFLYHISSYIKVTPPMIDPGSIMSHSLWSSFEMTSPVKNWTNVTFHKVPDFTTKDRRLKAHLESHFPLLMQDREEYQS